MNKTYLSITSVKRIAISILATGLMLPAAVPTANAATYSAPSAPLKVTSYIGTKGVVVRWTPATDVLPAVTGYVVSAGP